MENIKLKNMETKKEIKYVAYARKSTDQEEKQITSIDDQLKEIERIGKDCDIVETLTEKKSAKTLGRPIFAEMLKKIINREVQGIVCWKLNRLARNPVDGGQIIWMLQTGVIKEIRTEDGVYIPESDTLLLYLHFGMANQFSLNLSKDIKRGLKGRAEGGYRPSIAPLGYLNSKYHSKGIEEILVDQERFSKVRKLFDLMLTGQYSPLQLVGVAKNELKLETRGVGKHISKPMGKSNMYRILTNPFYYGEFEFPKGSGKWYEGNHKSIITKFEYDKIQFLLGREGRPRPKTHIFAYTGLMRCDDCGARIIAEEKFKIQKNGNSHHYIYYHCAGNVSKNCTEKSIEVKVLEKQIDEFLSKIEIPPEFHKWALKELKKLHENEKSDRNTILSTHRKKYEECVSKLDKLTDLLLEEKISQDVYKIKEIELQKNKKSLKNLLDNDDERIDNWIKRLESTLTFAQRAHEEFKNGDISKRRQILTALGTEHILKDRSIHIQLEKPLLVLQEVVSESNRISGSLEPPKDIGNNGQSNEIYAKSSLMWRWGKSNPRAEGFCKEVYIYGTFLF